VRIDRKVVKEEMIHCFDHGQGDDSTTVVVCYQFILNFLQF
jgi:hypothetical protein